MGTRARGLLIGSVLLLMIVFGSSESGATTTVRPMLIPSDRLAARPITGTAWTYMKARADAAVANMSLDSTPDATSPWLPNYNGSGQVTRPGTQVLAAALVYARTGDPAYKNFVVAANRFVMGTEYQTANDIPQTASSGKLLSTVRQLSSYVLAADLVGMDPNLTGSRVGWETTTWRTWLGQMRTRTIGTSGQGSNLTQLSNERANNWGAFATTTRVAIDIYLNDETDLAVAVSRFKRFLGDASQGSQWIADQDYDPSYACIPAGSVWGGINPPDCGLGKDGVIVEDLSRSAAAYPSYDSTGIGYTMESYQALLLTAILLDRQGYSPWSWSNQALKRVMDWLVREGYPQGNGSGVEHHQAWIARYFYGQTYPTDPAQMGRSLGFTDWLYPAG